MGNNVYDSFNQKFDPTGILKAIATGSEVEMITGIGRTEFKIRDAPMKSIKLGEKGAKGIKRGDENGVMLVEFVHKIKIMDRMRLSDIHEVVASHVMAIPYSMLTCDAVRVAEKL